MVYVPKVCVKNSDKAFIDKSPEKNITFCKKVKMKSKSFTYLMDGLNKRKRLSAKFK